MAYIFDQIIIYQWCRAVVNLSIFHWIWKRFIYWKIEQKICSVNDWRFSLLFLLHFFSAFWLNSSKKLVRTRQSQIRMNCHILSSQNCHIHTFGTLWEVSSSLSSPWCKRQPAYAYLTLKSAIEKKRTSFCIKNYFANLIKPRVIWGSEILMVELLLIQVRGSFGMVFSVWISSPYIFIWAYISLSFWQSFTYS